MRIYMVTFGSRGDNEPFRALAGAAAQAGHEVVFAHTSDLPLDPTAGYEKWSLPGSLEAMIAEQGVSLWKALRQYRSQWKPALEAVYEASTAHIEQLRPDVVVYHPKVLTAPAIAHSVGALAVCAELAPTLTPTKDFPAAGIPGQLPRWLNRASFSLVTLGLAAFGNRAKSLARELGGVSEQPDLTVCPISPSIIPQPADWPTNAHITGSWHIEPERQAPLDAELEGWLEGGSVVYAGFGSMKNGDASQRARVIVEASRRLGTRTLLVTGWGGLIPDDALRASSDVLVRTTVPHDTVLPRVELAIHHGGAGTTHAMLRSGVPSVIMPFLGDQPWWASRLHAQGLGPRAVPKDLARSDRLVDAMTEAMQCHEAVTKIAGSMRSEDGCARTVELIVAAREARRS